MKLLITGISGLLGLNLAIQVKDQFQVSGCYYTHPVALDGVATYGIDLRRTESWEPLLQELQPEVIIHTAGLTNVDACQLQPQQAYALNVEITRRLAQGSQRIGAKFVQISTDHLFDGNRPWRTESDRPQPVNVYAETKWQAEQVVSQTCPGALILRTNFFGWGTFKASFSDWILQTLARRQPLTMFADAFFTPILINDLVEVMLELIQGEASGLFHLAGGERLSKYAFALKLAEVFGYSTAEIRAIRLREFPLQAPRPLDLSLSSRKLEQWRSRPLPTATAGIQRLQALGATGWPQQLAQAIAPQP